MAVITIETLDKLAKALGVNASESIESVPDEFEGNDGKNLSRYVNCISTYLKGDILFLREKEIFSHLKNKMK